MAITSELQKIYGNTERNTGAKTYTLFRGEASDAKPTFAQPGDVFEEYDTGKVYVASRDGKNRTVWTEDQNAKRQTESGQTGLPTVSNANNGAVLKVANGAWALGTDNGLPVGFPAEGIANANKFVGFDANGDYEAKSAPTGGAEKFVVTLTQEDDTWTAADGVTVAEIYAAHQAEKECVAQFAYEYDGIDVPVEAPLAFAVGTGDGGETTYFCAFSIPFVLEASALAMLNVVGIGGDNDEWTVQVAEAGEYVPVYDSDNNGQVLGVSSGNLAWVDNYAPLVVTLTDNNGTTTGDKTYGEIHAAHMACRPVFIIGGEIGDGISTIVNNTFAGQESNTTVYQVCYSIGATNKQSEGSENDNFVYVD